MLKRIKRSLSLKTFLLLLILSIVMLVLSGVYAVRYTRSNLHEEYKNIVHVTSLYGADGIFDYINDPDKNLMDLIQFADDMQRLCEENVIDMFYVARQYGDDITKGDTLILVTQEERNVKGVDAFENIYDLDDDEIAILKHEKEDSEMIYMSRVGVVDSFIHGLDVVDEKTGEKCRILFGGNVKSAELDSSVVTLMMHLFIMIALLLVFFAILSGAIIWKVAVQPFKQLSERMTHFVENDTMTFEPMVVKGSDERAIVANHFNVMAENIQTYVERVREYEGTHQKQLAEMSIAADIQKGLLPKAQYTAEPFVVEGYMEPARNVGGDLYYYERLDENRMAFAIGDVSGKGITAALFMANTVSAIKYNLRNCTSPAKTISAINNDLAESNSNHLFVTLFVGILDAEEHTLTYCNAGHNPPYKISEKIEELSGGKGFLAGIFKDELYEDAVIRLEENEQILLYTDGVTEALNANNEFFGQERLEECLGGKKDITIQDILSELKAFTGDAVQSDDITMMTLRFEKKKK